MSHTCYMDETGMVCMLHYDGAPDQRPFAHMTAVPWDGIMPDPAWRIPWVYDVGSGSLSERPLTVEESADAAEAEAARSLLYVEAIASGGSPELIAELERRRDLTPAQRLAEIR